MSSVFPALSVTWKRTVICAVVFIPASTAVVSITIVFVLKSSPQLPLATALLKSPFLYTLYVPLANPLLSSLNSPLKVRFPFTFPVTFPSLPVLLSTSGSAVSLFTLGAFTSYEMFLVFSVAFPWLAVIFMI